MKEPKNLKINPFTGLIDGGFEGFVHMKDEVGVLEANRYGIEHVYLVCDEILPAREDAMRGDAGWFYVWEYEPNAVVFFVPKGESDTFNLIEAAEHIKVGRLAHGQSTGTLAIMTTLSEDAMDVIYRLGDFHRDYPIHWTEYE